MSTMEVTERKVSAPDTDNVNDSDGLCPKHSVGLDTDAFGRKHCPICEHRCSTWEEYRAGLPV